MGKLIYQGIFRKKPRSRDWQNARKSKNSPDSF